MQFEILEHTADIGFRAWGATFGELLDHASQALVSIYLDQEKVAPVDAFPIAASGEDRESLLVNWLNEVLYYVDGRGIALRRFDVARYTSTEAAGTAWGEARTDRHPARLIVKGVTYHQLCVEQTAGAWSCQVFLDI